MKISEASIKSGLSTDTIRYYEKCEMLPEIERSSDGHRNFSQKNLEWLTLLYWLRETGMPLMQMKSFTALAKVGDATVTERCKILLAHSSELKQRRSLLDRCEEVLAIKLTSYEKNTKGSQ